jgi:hypothetical protein
MANSSKILLDLIGSINTDEDFSKVKVNCIEEDESTSRAGLEGADYEVLFPEASSAGSGDFDVVPLIGGSIVKIAFKGTDIRPLSADKLGRYNLPIKELATFAKNKIEQISDSDSQKISELVSARVKINRALQNMPNITTGLHSSGLPSLYMSSLRSSLSSVDSVNSEVESKNKKRIRLSSVSKIGGFKFIPIEKIKSILEALTQELSNPIFGLKNYVGISGVTFGELTGFLSDIDIDNITDERISQILLELFPIFHIKEDFIESSKSQGVIGYYTEVNGSLYIKTPDLSGRNSSGVINLEGTSDDENLFFCFELINKQSKDYKAIVFDHAFPPDIEVIDADLTYPSDESDIFLTISEEGHDSSYKYFLSPIIAPQQLVNLPVGFVEADDALEMFTAPVLTKPYFKNSLRAIVDPEVIANPGAEPKDQETKLKRLMKSLDDYIKDSFSTRIYAGDGDVILGSLYDHKDVGIPLSVSAEPIGATSSTDLLGEMNRPEMVLGSRDFSKETYLLNDQRWFNQKICSARSFAVFVCPNILTDIGQIPANWIALGSPALGEEGITLKIPFGENNAGVSLYNPGIVSSFALYAVDKYGQIIRVSGENIKINPQSFIISSLTPDGFLEDGTVLHKNSDIENLTIELTEPIGSGSISLYEAISETEPGNRILFDADGITISHQSQQLILSSSDSDSLIKNLFGTRTGKFFIQIVLNTGITSDFILINIESEGTVIGDVPSAPDPRITFKDPNLLKAPRFGREIDSIPLLMDDKTNAEIILRYDKPVFKKGLELYAYIGVLNNQENNDILKEDIGWPTTVTKSSSPLVYTLLDTPDHTSLIIPTGLEYELGSEYFSRINNGTNRRVKLKFPGPGSKLNLSRFNQLTYSGGNYRAYIILSNSKITDATPILQKPNYAIIPIGSKKGEEDKPAFINPPHITGLAIRVSGAGIGTDQSFSNISKAGVDSCGKYIDWLDSTQGGPIAYQAELKTNNKIERLAVIFNGPPDEPRKSRSYSFTIGSGSSAKKITKYRFGFVKGESEKLVANFHNITGITDTGYLDVVVTKKDKRFNVTYDSTVYNRLTVNFSGSGEVIDDSIVKNDPSISEDAMILASEENKLIPYIFYDQISPYPNIFPANLGLSSIPIQTDPGKWAFTPTTSFLRFPSPIKIYPSVDLIFGSEIDGKTYGMFLSDSDANPSKENSHGEIVKINILGDSEAQIPLSEVQAGIDRVKEQGEEQLANLDRQKAALESEKEGATEGEVSDIDGKIQEIEEKQADYNQALTTADAASASATEASDAAESADPSSAAASAAGAATGAAADALGLLEDGLALIQSLTDKLSSLTQLASQAADGLVQSASAMEPRASDFTRTNIDNIYIDKDSLIPTSFIQQTDDNTEFKLTLTFRFGQTSAIKFNVPEIIEIEDDGGARYSANGDLKFSDFRLKSNKAFFIIASGATRDTKVELGGRRLKILGFKLVGINQRFKVRAPDLGSSLYGADNCISIALTNSSEKHMQIARQLGNDIAIDLEDKIESSISGGARSKRGSPSDLKEKLEERYLKFMSVTLDKANVPKEQIQSFCDMSFHLTAELTMQLRNFKVLLVPIKVIFCIIDVICALLNPIALVFAIIRLFLCLYDLILLLPQLAVPAMALALVLHVVELLLCIIIKVLGIINAINEISTALQNAIEQKNYPAIIALEETIAEHLASLEADLTVLDPILNVLALFLELLSLTFAFPCQIKTDADEEACIDPSQLAGLIMSKVVPAGRIVPDALLPMAQTYTTLPVDDVGSAGNTPPAIFDFGSILSEVSEQASGVEIVSDNTGFGGRPLPGIRSSLTGDNILIEEGGFFEGDLDGNGEHDNVNYQSLRFNGGSFEGTFGLSFSRSTKEFAIFTGPDPRMVWFEFNESGKTAPHAFIPFFAPFFDKKTIDNLQTLDSPPSFLKPDGNSLKIAGDMDDIGFVSPIDGASDKDTTGGFFLERGADLNGARTYQPKPLTVTFELQEPGVNPDTLSAEFTPVEVTKTFGSIPMIALIDDEFNIYFVEEPGTGQGGIIVEDVNGVPAITAIHAKMMNFPTAPKKAFAVEGREIYLSFTELNPDPASIQAASLEALENDHEINAGEILIWQQANYNAIADSADQPFEFFADGTAVGDYNYVGGSPEDIDAITRAANTINVFDFPTLYIVDMRQLADDIAAACGASGPTELLLDLPGFTDTETIEDSITTLSECTQAFLDYFSSTIEDLNGVPVGIIPKVRSFLELGNVPEQISVRDVIDQYNILKDCYEGEIDNICGFVINPLNTSFKLLNDEDETPLTDFIDPEQEGLANLINFDIVDELEFDEELDGFPKITGAMEYASGVGDSAIVTVGSKAVINITPRDCYDDVLSPALDLTDSIKIDFLRDDTGGAKLASPSEGNEASIFEKNGGEYTFAITAPAAGIVKVRATVCSTVIQAVTDRGIIIPETDELEAKVDCVDDSAISIAEAEEVFAPGALTKVDRILTILFAKGIDSSSSGDKDRENSAKSSKPTPQTFGTKLEN